MADRTVKVTLTAQVQGYIDGMEKAAKATRETGSASEKLTAQREAFEQVGRVGMAAGGAIAVGLGLATKAAIDWDSAWAGVTKTVDGSDAELAAVEKGLRGLTEVLPASHAEIAAVAEAAGQLGVKTPNVVAFTKTMIDLGETTNLAADEAATSLARFMTVMGSDQKNVDRLGSALVGLGNNFATTEAEIMSMAMRLSGAGAQIGLTEGQVLGLSTALSSVGIEAEAGGSAMSKVMISIASEVEKGGDKLALFADAAGMSANDFASKWRSDPANALAAFVAGLANAEAQGKSTFAVLEELGITEVRMRDALLRSSLAADEFAKAMEMGNEEFEKNSALTEEANKRYETTAAKLSIMTNRITDAAIGIGQQFLPVVEAGSEKVGAFADMLGSLPGPAQAGIAWIAAIGAAVALGGGMFLTAVPKVAAYQASLATLGATAQRTHAILSTVGKAAGIIGLAVVVTEVGLGLADWSAKLAGAKKSADDLKDSFLETSNTAREMSELLAASKFTPLGVNENSGVANLRAMNSVVGDLTAKFQSSEFALGKFSTWVSTLGVGGELGRAKDNIKELDVALAELVASGDSNAAAHAFEEFSARATEAGWSAEKIAESLPQYTDAVKQLPSPTEESARSARNAAESYVEQANAAQAAADELMGLIDALMVANDVGQSSEAANARYQKTLSEVAETVKKAQEGVDGYSASMDANTVEGSKNREMFAGLAADSQKAAYGLLQQETVTLGASKATQNYAARLAEGRAQLVEHIAALTGNREAAEEFANTVYKMPTEQELEYMSNAAEETSAAIRYTEAINAIPSEKWTKLFVNRGNSAAELKAHIAALNNIPGYRETVINTVVRQTGAARGQVGAAYNEDGGFYAAGIQHFANGGIPTGVYSGGSTLYGFAEKNVPWEAFISGKPGQEARNRQIWVESGERLGMGRLIGDAIKSALAGVETPQRSGTVINYTSVNPVVRDDFEDALNKADRAGVRV